MNMSTGKTMMGITIMARIVRRSLNASLSSFPATVMILPKFIARPSLSHQLYEDAFQILLGRPLLKLSNCSERDDFCVIDDR